jgi:hypothetical protein
MWNPVHFAIYFGRQKIVQFLFDEMRIDIRQALQIPAFKNEFFPNPVSSPFCEDADTRLSEKNNQEQAKRILRIQMRLVNKQMPLNELQVTQQ